MILPNLGGTEGPVQLQNLTLFEYIWLFSRIPQSYINQTPFDMILFIYFHIQVATRSMKHLQISFYSRISRLKTSKDDFFLLGFLLNDYFLQTITLFEYIPLFSWAYHSREYLLWRTVTY